MDRIRQLLSDSLDGPLSAADAEEVARHLRQDPRLRAEFVELYQLHRVLATELKPFAEAPFKAAVFDELRRDEQAFVGSVMRRLEADDLGDPAARERREAATRPSPRLGFPLEPRSWFDWFSRPAWAALAACLILGTVSLALLELRPEPVRAQLCEIRGNAILQRSRRIIPAREGFALRHGDTLQTPADATMAVQYLGEPTRVELKPGTSVQVAGGRQGKRLELRAGRVESVVAPQPPGRPFVLITPQAQARVLGTRFGLSAKPWSTRLEVTEGKVELSGAASRRPVLVGPGEYAVAARGLDLTPRPLPADAELEPHVPIRIAWFSEYPEDEDWITNPGFVEQRRTYGEAFHPYRAPPVEGSVLLEGLVRVDQLGPGVAGSGEGWGFGIGLRCAEAQLPVFLQTLQRPSAGCLVELTDRVEGPLASSPIEVPPGCYQLQLRLDRLSGDRVRLRGKLWRQFELEPASWMLIAEAPGVGPLSAIGLSTRNCACTFAQLSLWFLE
jgi:ferric-dicitrate binding protein FerR (iron transport regulator)